MSAEAGKGELIQSDGFIPEKLIFVSYRNSDVPGDARAIVERLEREFEGAVYYQLEDEPGDDVEGILEILKRCKVLVVVMGPHWVGPLTENEFRSVNHQEIRRSIDDPGDWVRREVESGLSLRAHGMLVIPVVISEPDGSCVIPEDLPEPLTDLVKKIKYMLVPGTYFRSAMDRMVKKIKNHLSHDAEEESATVAASAGPWDRNVVAAAGICGVSSLVVVSQATWLDALPSTALSLIYFLAAAWDAKRS